MAKYLIRQERLNLMSSTPIIRIIATNQNANDMDLSDARWIADRVMDETFPPCHTALAAQALLLLVAAEEKVARDGSRIPALTRFISA